MDGRDTRNRKQFYKMHEKRYDKERFDEASRLGLYQKRLIAFSLFIITGCVLLFSGVMYISSLALVVSYGVRVVSYIWYGLFILTLVVSVCWFISKQKTLGGRKAVASSVRARQRILVVQCVVLLMFGIWSATLFIGYALPIASRFNFENIRFLLQSNDNPENGKDKLEIIQHSYKFFLWMGVFFVVNGIALPTIIANYVIFSKRLFDILGPDVRFWKPGVNGVFYFFILIFLSPAILDLFYLFSDESGAWGDAASGRYIFFVLSVLTCASGFSFVKYISRLQNVMSRTDFKENAFRSIIATQVSSAWSEQFRSVALELAIDIKKKDPVAFSSPIIVIDLVGFSNLSDRFTHSSAHPMVNSLLRKIVEIGKLFGFLLIKTMGDGTIFVCPPQSYLDQDKRRIASENCYDAIGFSVLVQRFISEFSKKERIPIDIRIGMSFGNIEMSFHEGLGSSFDIFGEDVNIASRLEALAADGAIYANRSLCENLLQNLIDRQNKGQDTEHSKYFDSESLTDSSSSTSPETFPILEFVNTLALMNSSFDHTPVETSCSLVAKDFREMRESGLLALSPSQEGSRKFFDIQFQLKIKMRAVEGPLEVGSKSGGTRKNMVSAFNISIREIDIEGLREETLRKLDDAYFDEGKSLGMSDLSGDDGSTETVTGTAHVTQESLSRTKLKRTAVLEGIIKRHKIAFGLKGIGRRVNACEVNAKYMGSSPETNEESLKKEM